MTAPAAPDVLTGGFPSAGEMLSWLWATTAGWTGEHLLFVAPGVVALVLGYLAWAFLSAVRAV